MTIDEIRAAHARQVIRLQPSAFDVEDLENMFVRQHAQSMLPLAMGAIQVKNVPDDLHEALRRRATHEGMDLQNYLLQLIRRELSLPSETEWLEELRAQPTAIGLPAAAEMLRADREDRERHLDGRGNRH